MQQHCEVCEAFRPEGKVLPDEKIVYMEFPARTVRLCVGHAMIAQNSGVHSFEELRDLYGSGRRSHVPRRGSEMFESTDEKRRSPGRRAVDVRG